jgi:radical SAM protein with 4Fe4S-binding SPASM domain
MPRTLEVQQFPFWEKLKNKRVPLSFDIEVTARCNNDCRHCYINVGAGDRAAGECELSVAEIGNIAGQAVRLGAVWCLITGGEPLLRSDFPDLYLTLKRKGLLVSILTNATLVNDEHVALFKKYPPRDVEVTVYGVTQDTYERVTRRPGSFAAFRGGLDFLLESDIKVRLKTMALRSNVHELPAIAHFCRERTKDYFRFDPLLHLRFDGNAARNAEIRAERLTPAEIVAIERADEERFSALQEWYDKEVVPEFAHSGCDDLFRCSAGSNSFNVSYDGHFRLCSSLCHPESVYDLRKGTLAEAWHTFVPQVRDLRFHSRELLGTCRRCPFIDLCLWCPAHAHLETGELDGAVPYFCEVAHARAAALMASAQEGT